MNTDMIYGIIIIVAVVAIIIINISNRKQTPKEEKQKPKKKELEINNVTLSSNYNTTQTVNNKRIPRIKDEDQKNHTIESPYKIKKIHVPVEKEQEETEEEII